MDRIREVMIKSRKRKEPRVTRRVNTRVCQRHKKKTLGRRGLRVPDTKWLRERLIDVGYNQAGLARYLHVSEPAVSLMIRGKGRRWRPEEIKTFAKLVGSSVDEVMRRLGY